MSTHSVRPPILSQSNASSPIPCSSQKDSGIWLCVALLCSGLVSAFSNHFHLFNAQASATLPGAEPTPPPPSWTHAPASCCCEMKLATCCAPVCVRGGAGWAPSVPTHSLTRVFPSPSLPLQIAGQRMRAASIAVVYRHALEQTIAQRKGKEIGEVVQLTSNDCQKVSQSCGECSCSAPLGSAQ